MDHGIIPYFITDLCNNKTQDNTTCHTMIIRVLITPQ